MRGNILWATTCIKTTVCTLQIQAGKAKQGILIKIDLMKDNRNHKDLKCNAKVKQLKNKFNVVVKKV